MIGLSVGESKTVEHSFPEDWEVEELKGKSVEIGITVKTVRGVILPDLDDELAKAAAKRQENDLRTLRTDLEKQISLRDVELDRLRTILRQHLAKIAGLQNLVDSTKNYLDSLDEFD